MRAFRRADVAATVNLLGASRPAARGRRAPSRGGALRARRRPPRSRRARLRSRVLRGSGGGGRRRKVPRGRFACADRARQPPGTDGPRRGPRRARRARAAGDRAVRAARRRSGSGTDVASGRLRARGHAGSVRRVAGGVRAGARALPALGLVGRRLPVRARGGALLRSDPRLGGNRTLRAAAGGDVRPHGHRTAARLSRRPAGALRTLRRGARDARRRGDDPARARGDLRSRQQQRSPPRAHSPARR